MLPISLYLLLFHNTMPPWRNALHFAATAADPPGRPVSWEVGANLVFALHCPPDDAGEVTAQRMATTAGDTSVRPYTSRPAPATAFAAWVVMAPGLGEHEVRPYCHS
jgi:hypothetical protein